MADAVNHDHLTAISRVYGPEAWEIYDRLDRSLDPRGPETLLALATELVTAASVVLDVGCRDAAHLIELVRATGARGVGLDPVSRLVNRARAGVNEAGLDERVRIVEGAMHDMPFPDASFDLVWCRDVIEIVQNLEAGIGEIVRVLRPGGQLIIYTVYASDRLEPNEADLLFGGNLALVRENLDESCVESIFDRSGLTVTLKEVVGTEWREYAEERTRPASRDLLRLARLRRQQAAIIDEAGEDIYRHIESNLHWAAYQLLGKLLPTVYMLRRPS